MANVKQQQTELAGEKSLAGSLNIGNTFKCGQCQTSNVVAYHTYKKFLQYAFHNIKRLRIGNVLVCLHYSKILQVIRSWVGAMD